MSKVLKSFVEFNGVNPEEPSIEMVGGGSSSETAVPTIRSCLKGKRGYKLHRISWFDEVAEVTVHLPLVIDENYVNDVLKEVVDAAEDATYWEEENLMRRMRYEAVQKELLHRAEEKAQMALLERYVKAMQAKNAEAPKRSWMRKK